MTGADVLYGVMCGQASERQILYGMTLWLTCLTLPWSISYCGSHPSRSQPIALLGPLSVWTGGGCTHFA
jgi:hypothetical protein